jgi:hypothetical protein
VIGVNTRKYGDMINESKYLLEGTKSGKAGTSKENRSCDLVLRMIKLALSCESDSFLHKSAIVFLLFVFIHTGIDSAKIRRLAMFSMEAGTTLSLLQKSWKHVQYSQTFERLDISSVMHCLEITEEARIHAKSSSLRAAENAVE